MENNDFYVGMPVISLRKNNIRTTIAFAGKHNGTFKILHKELLEKYPDKGGWNYKSDYELDVNREIDYEIY